MRNMTHKEGEQISLPTLPIERVGDAGGREELIIRLNGCGEGDYLTNLGRVSIKWNGKSEIVINCSDCEILQGKRNRNTRTIQLGGDGKGSQQISNDLNLVVDWGKRIRPKYYMYPVEHTSKVLGNPSHSWVSWEYGHEIWGR